MYNNGHMSTSGNKLAPPVPPATDRRIARTRAALRDAVFALIRERGFDAVTVQDITDRANLSRATFYLHFRDKEELLTVSLQEIYETLRGPGPDPTLDALRADPKVERDFYASDLQHVADHAELYRTMLSEQGVWPFWTRILDYLYDKARADFARIARDNARPPVVPIELVASFCAGASLGVLRWWLLEAPQTPLDELADMIRQIESYGLWWSLGVDMPRPPIPPAPRAKRAR